LKPGTPRGSAPSPAGHGFQSQLTSLVQGGNSSLSSLDHLRAVPTLELAGNCHVVAGEGQQRKPPSDAGDSPGGRGRLARRSCRRRLPRLYPKKFSAPAWPAPTAESAPRRSQQPDGDVMSSRSTTSRKCEGRAGGARPWREGVQPGRPSRGGFSPSPTGQKTRAEGRGASGPCGSPVPSRVGEESGGGLPVHASGGRGGGVLSPLGATLKNIFHEWDFPARTTSDFSGRGGWLVGRLLAERGGKMPVAQLRRRSGQA